MQSNGEKMLRANALGWAHLCLAFADQAESETLANKGIQTTVLVDADIVIGHAKPSQQNALFRDLLVAGNREESPVLLAGMSAYFFDWLFGTVDKSVRPERHPWLIAPEHYREVVNKAKSVFDEQDGPITRSQSASKLELIDDAVPKRFERLTDLLNRLQSDPWTSIDEDLTDLLGMLGVDGLEPPTHKVVAALILWLRQYRNHVIGAGSRTNDCSLALKWPNFVHSRERELIRMWREALIPYRTAASSAGAIDTDARVLAAMTLLNENWRSNQHRVVLLTGSLSVLRAVCDQGLDPLTARLSHRTERAPDAMCDFVCLPSLVLASPELSGLGADRSGGDLPAASKLLLGEHDLSLAERRNLFELIAHRHSRHGVDKETEKGNAGRSETVPINFNLPERLQVLTQYRFSDYFRENVKTSMALEHVLKKLNDERQMGIAKAKNQVQQASSLNLLVEQLHQLSEVKQVRMRIELLELLIVAETDRAHSGNADQHRNCLRSAPFVDWGNHSCADELSEALASLDNVAGLPAMEARIASLKVKVYKDDPTTYLLCLVFARHYARQGRWELASSAAHYAFKLSQTDLQRPDDILGEEAVFLELACQRRGAQTFDDIDRALQALRDHLAHIRAEDPRLAAARLGVERISMSLTRLFLCFFQKGEIGGSLHESASQLLGDAIAQLDDMQTSVPAEVTRLTGARADVHDRLIVNVCNLAWLTVGWDPHELGRSRVVGSKRTLFTKHQDVVTVARVDASLLRLKQICDVSNIGHRKSSSFDWLSQVLCALHLSPDLLNWPEESARVLVTERLNRLKAEEVDHPYDAQRVAYALELASKLRLSVGSK